MYLRYVHSFRAVAILIIVAGHAVVTLTWPQISPTRDFLLDLLDNGTVLFVFVAGFLFHHLAGRYEYRDYLKKKLLNVIIPYVLVSLPAVLYTVRFTDAETRYPELAGTADAYQVGWMLIKGGATFNYPLWFIPMITLLYLAAPVLIQFVHHPRLYAVLVVLIPLSMLAHRANELDTFSIALYFLPAYITGMWASHHRRRLEPFLDRFWLGLTIAFLAAVALNFVLATHHGNYYGAVIFSQEHGLIDWMFAQKLLLCFALLALLRRLDGLIADRLRFVGEVSFTIFFVHCYVLFGVQVFFFNVLGYLPPGNAGTFFVLTVAAAALSAGSAALVKRTVGKRSRYLIGS
jgi:probable poly-beta-1,6-N-acetyl-D-glucosamine export protein